MGTGLENTSSHTVVLPETLSAPGIAQGSTCNQDSSMHFLDVSHNPAWFVSAYNVSLTQFKYYSLVRRVDSFLIY